MGAPPSRSDYDAFLRWAAAHLHLHWRGYARVRKMAHKRIGKRLRELALASLHEYRSYLQQQPEEWQRLDALVRIVVSRFYRDPPVFDALRDRWLPQLAASARRDQRAEIAIWSAGCASGEEPWSVRILWDRHLARDYRGIELTVLATDADEGVLARAQRAVYPPSSLASAPSGWRTQAFSLRDGQYRLADHHRHGVTFALQDLRTEMPQGPFDLILCRNLAFTYFDEPLRTRIAQQLRQRLRPGGHILVGRHERLP